MYRVPVIAAALIAIGLLLAPAQTAVFLQSAVTGAVRSAATAVAALSGK